VIDTIPTLAWCNLAHGPNEFLNKRWHEYTGLSPEESNDWAWQAAFHPDDLPPLMEKWRELLASEKQERSKPDFADTTESFAASSFGWNHSATNTGKIIRWYGTSTDIEALKQTQEKLREDERELRRITDAIPQTIVVWTRPARRYTPTRRPWITQAAPAKMCSFLTFANGFFHPDDLERLRTSEGPRWTADFHSKPKCARSGKMADTAGSSFVQPFPQ